MLSGLFALVTGGASGLGRATVERFIKQGARVLICDLQSSGGEKLAEELGANAKFASCDVSSEDDVTKMFDKCKQLDVLVNCAGVAASQRVFHPKKKTPHSLDDFIKVQKVNLIGTFNTIRMGSLLMSDNTPDEDGQRGVIVNTASIAAFDGQIGQAAYAASKGGIVGMTLPLARDLSISGIRVVTIAPGLFSTPLLAKLPDNMVEALVSTIPFPKRFGRPDEYAHLVETIVLNKMLNGETIRLDGGLRMNF